jgi:hypothetical protein
LLTASNNAGVTRGRSLPRATDSTSW